MEFLNPPTLGQGLLLGGDERAYLQKANMKQHASCLASIHLNYFSQYLIQKWNFCRTNIVCLFKRTVFSFCFFLDFLEIKLLGNKWEEK